MMFFYKDRLLDDPSSLISQDMPHPISGVNQLYTTGKRPLLSQSLSLSQSQTVSVNQSTSQLVAAR